MKFAAKHKPKSESKMVRYCLNYDDICYELCSCIRCLQPKDCHSCHPNLDCGYRDVWDETGKKLNDRKL